MERNQRNDDTIDRDELENFSSLYLSSHALFHCRLSSALFRDFCDVTTRNRISIWFTNFAGDLLISISSVSHCCKLLNFPSCLQTPVYVYYESLCPDSQAFITKQLYPSMKILKDHVDLHLVPFGKSTVRWRRWSASPWCLRFVLLFMTVSNARCRYNLRVSSWTEWS